ncbi:DUF5125 domain-containing protein [Sphingobacterium sp. lm-10]|uniref:DUF5125 domain-containing protein n=1 Tax=Sphingobacterium sp. lm-10 TaxID=2944904 RepID=UPI002021991A|nr:DUF5125 domain-containing protein [Sphingobacterium sp. lm-10]MCL7988775.1 DUF5125 domain-containing protein [Sphingobacterium sp. lm-10]
MKKHLFFIGCMLAILATAGCKKEQSAMDGSPEMTLHTTFETAYFADSLQFSVDVRDGNGVPLSTLKAYLYYGDEVVSETTIRTKEYGRYDGKLYAPYYAQIPNGSATIRLVLQNINQSKSEQQVGVPLQRPDYPYLTFVAEDSTRHEMNRTALYQYTVEKEFPMKIKGYIEAPAFGENGNVVRFGYTGDKITEGNSSLISFSYLSDGVYPITFNTLSYEAGPFLSYSINDVDLLLSGEELYTADLSLQKDQVLRIDGIADLADWWIDSDFIREVDGEYRFNAMNGNYRITADFVRKYFIIEAVQAGQLAKLNADGTGAIWIIGEGIGKPNLDNQVGWTTEKALCMAPIGNKRYRVTVVGGESMRANNINFKFFHQKGWGGEFGGSHIATESDLIFIGDGTNGRDSGNLGIITGASLEAGTTYVLTVDLSAGNQAAMLTVEKR